MPQLDPANLPTSTLATVCAVIVDQLSAAQGVNGPLNVSVINGIDGILKDAIQANPLDSLCPAVRVTYSTETLEVASNSGGGVRYKVPFYLYFIYYLGNIATDSVQQNFSELREQHIAWNLEYLQTLGIAPNTTIGLSPTQFKLGTAQVWRWTPDPWQIQHDVNFQYMGKTVRLDGSNGYTCSKVTCYAFVPKHAV